jgi:hypothetical protein
VVKLPISRKILRGEGVVIALQQVFANQYSSSTEIKSLLFKSCYVEEVYFQAVKFVRIYSCAFNHPRTMPK